MPYIVGIDGGTESLRAAVFDVSGNVISTSSIAYETSFPHPSWAEQDPADWWQVCCVQNGFASVVLLCLHDCHWQL